MNRKPIRSLLASAILALVLALGVFGGSSGLFATRALAASNGRTIVLHVVEHYVHYKEFELGSSGKPHGYIQTFFDPLYDKTDTYRIGYESGSCISTLAKKVYECTWTNIFKDGQITVEGPSYEQGDSLFSITGGTGRYSQARGQMKAHPISVAGGLGYDYTFYIIKH